MTDLSLYSHLWSIILFGATLSFGPYLNKIFLFENWKNFTYLSLLIYNNKKLKNVKLFDRFSFRIKSS